MAELKPCPFCGSTNISCADAGHKTDVWFVQCENCGATFPFFDSETEAAEAWNRRVAKKPKPHTVDVEKLKIGNANWCKGTTVYRCPNCNDFISRTYDFCYKCGQKLDWSDDNA